jgi:hypothetical protein
MAKPNPRDILTADEQEGFSPRGRKRRRPSDGVTPPVHNPSGGSTTMRGRGRRRSTSDISSRSENSSKPSLLVRTQLGRKHQKKIPKSSVETKRRSQSPSRSRTRGAERTPTRRRQRTTSRSRSHGMEKGGRDRLGVDDRKETDGRSSRQHAEGASDNVFDVNSGTR